MTIGLDKDICEILKKPLPEYSRKGPGGKYTYYKGSDVIARLNEAFGHGWSSEKIESQQFDDHVLILVSLTVYVGGDTIIHHGYGSAQIARHRESGKVIDIGNTYKSAFTNAIKKAAEQFGIGLGSSEEEVTSSQPKPAPMPAQGVNTEKKFSPPNGGSQVRSNPPRKAAGAAASGMASRPPAGMNSTPPAGMMSTPPTPMPDKDLPVKNQPMPTPDLEGQKLSFTQEKALHNLAKMKNKSEQELIKGALPDTGKSSFGELLKKEAIEVIKYANRLS